MSKIHYTQITLYPELDYSGQVTFRAKVKLQNGQEVNLMHRIPESHFESLFDSAWEFIKEQLKEAIKAQTKKAVGNPHADDMLAALTERY